jgi:hypothetical protein
MNTRIRKLQQLAKVGIAKKIPFFLAIYNLNHLKDKIVHLFALKGLGYWIYCCIKLHNGGLVFTQIASQISRILQYSLN